MEENGSEKIRQDKDERSYAQQSMSWHWDDCWRVAADWLQVSQELKQRRAQPQLERPTVSPRKVESMLLS
jgi:hypothetical protein